MVFSRSLLGERYLSGPLVTLEKPFLRFQGFLDAAQNEECHTSYGSACSQQNS